MAERALVVQSHTSPLPAPWYQRCVDSVRRWADARGFEYRWLGDELLAAVPRQILLKTEDRRVVATDLARLIVLQDALIEGFDRVIWMDADVLVLNVRQLELPDSAALFGREMWIQRGERGTLRVHRKIHNAFMAFRAGESVLPFYRYSAERILARYDSESGPMVAQLVGPKLLTLLHNAIGFDVLESAAVLCPLVARDLLNDGGPALKKFAAASNAAPLALNLCGSLCGSSVRPGQITDREMDLLITMLETQPVF